MKEGKSVNKRVLSRAVSVRGAHKLLARVMLLGLLGCGPIGPGSGVNNDFGEAPGPDQIPGKYIVVFKQDAGFGAQDSLTALSALQATMNNVEDEYQLKPSSQVFYRALRGGVYEMTEAQAAALSEDSKVAYVEMDQVVRANTVQSLPTWGLDRLDQTDLPLNKSYSYDGASTPVNVYVIDTGILNRHEEFQGRASSGIDVIDNDGDSTDCNGHGTHVAGTIGSRSYGVMKNANLIGVRVLACNGSGSNSGVIAGIEWVTAHHRGPSVANMSLGGGRSQALEDAMAASIRSGVTYVVAAGNENTSACLSSPAHLSTAIRVGATTSTDERSSFSNYGECVDLFAPGSQITSTWVTSVTATNTISGTSMASPHAAGVAALYLSRNPSATPAQVKKAMLEGATVGKVGSPGPQSPNLLLNTKFLDSATPDEGANELKNGVEVSSLTGTRGSQRQYSVQVPSGAKRLTIEISGGSGDADLYVRYGQKPTSTQYDCRPYTSGNGEQCVVIQPKGGTYHVMVNAYSSYSNLKLKALFK